MKNSYRILIRLLIAAALMVGVYFETGPFTVITFSLIYLSFEVTDYWIRKAVNLLRGFNKDIDLSNE